MPVAKSAEGRARQRAAWKKNLDRNRASAKVSALKTIHTKKALLTLPEVKAPTLEEIEAKYGKVGGA
jgi:hypothetical protein